MNNSIQEDYVSFEVAKLLKEKGFRVSTSRYYKPNGEIVVNFEDSEGESEYYFDADSFDENWNDGRVMDNKNNFCYGCSSTKGYFPVISLPTHAVSIKWIRENFGIHIYTYPDGRFHEGWYFGIYNSPVGAIDYYPLYHSDADFDSSEEAIEAALLHTLQNLIP